MRQHFPQDPDGNSAYQHFVVTLLRQRSNSAKPIIWLDDSSAIIGDAVCVTGKAKFTVEQVKEFAKRKFTHCVLAPGAKVSWPNTAALRTVPLKDDEVSAMASEFEPFALRYLAPEVPKRKRIDLLTQRYNLELVKLHGRIQFVGMSVYKVEASEGIPIERIYIPLRVVGEAESEREVGVNPLGLLKPGSRRVILGDPGSGKSTLLRFIALAGTQHTLRQAFQAPPDTRLCLFVTLRRFGDALKSRPALTLFDYFLEVARADLKIKELDQDWLEYYLYARDAILLLDGLDELPNTKFKQTVRQKVEDLLDQYPGNTVVMSSRIVGYEKEVRYESFSHHKVARLNPKDIETFVENWYAARIENEAERERHVGDLVRLVGEGADTPIRELAENPLLLTIITLVHRIDAVLPDERVVLYQKCTETLLNTWHTWKYQAEQAGARPKVDRRNNARMEAVAYWMHCLMDSGEKHQRSVVPFEELRDFLARFIAQAERQTAAAALAAAVEFLAFVKERAGLLIEVGEGQYSFLHLTFQEYLAATHLRASGEAGGVVVVWKALDKDKRQANPRWHEVIRLLVASYGVESQQYLLKRLLPKARSPHLERCAWVVGGCLIDSVEAAQDMAEAIVDRLFRAAMVAETVESLRVTLGLLKSWERKGPAATGLLRRVAAKIRVGGGAETAHLLTQACLDWETAEILRRADMSFVSRPEQASHLTVLQAALSSKEWQPLPKRERKLLLAAAAEQALSSPEGNRFSLVIVGWGGLDAPSQPCPPFLHLVTCLSHLRGPMEHFFANLLHARATCDERIRGVRQEARRVGGGTRALRLFPGPHPSSDLRGDDVIRKRARDRARDLVKAIKISKPEGLLGRSPRTKAGAPDHVRQTLGAAESWAPEFSTPFIEVIGQALGLTTIPLWHELVRTRLLPRIPARLTVADPGLWQEVEEKFRTGRAEQADALHAACFLLLDIWFWASECYDRPNASQFHALAEFTRTSSNPELRIAHCFRDLAHGHKERLADFERLKREPQTRQILIDAFVIDKSEGTPPPKKKRKK